MARKHFGGIPEMVIPMQGTERARGLLGQAATSLGMSGRSGAAQGDVNVTMNAPITINGVPADKEQSVAREVKRVIQDSTRDLIERLKVARNFESRLGYV